MKRLLFTSAFLTGILAGASPAISNADSEPRPLPVPLVAQRVEPFIMLRDCKIVRDQEPKGDLTYKVRAYDGEHTVTRPIYSDLCTHPTQQFITKIYYRLASSPYVPVIGIVGGNQDGTEIGFPNFSGFVLKLN